MAILERRIQAIKKESEYLDWEKKWEAIEQRVGGFPTKRHYQLISGRDDSNTMVWEREWEGFAAAEAAYGKLWADPETQSLASTAPSIVSSERIEYYMVM